MHQSPRERRFRRFFFTLVVFSLLIVFNATGEERDAAGEERDALDVAGDETDAGGEEGDAPKVEQQTNVYASDYWLLVGLCLAVLAALVGAIGDITIKFSYNREKQREVSRPLYKRPFWLLGTFCDVCLVPIPTVAALFVLAGSTANLYSGLHICFSVILAWLILGERLSPLDVMACGTIVTGIYLVARYGPRPRFSFFNEIFVDSFGLYLYVGICFSLTLFCIVASLPINAIYEEVPLPVQEIATATVAGIASANTTLCAKGVTVIIATEGWVTGYWWQLMLLLMLTGTAGLILMIYINYGLWRFRASLLVPSIYSVQVIAGTSGGIALYNEVPKTWSFFVIGVVLQVVSIFLLSIGFDKHPPHEIYADPLAEKTYSFEDLRKPLHRSKPHQSESQKNE